MRRTKSAHLIYNQKFYIFNCYRGDESPSRIWQRTGISISTAKMILRDFITKANRMKIYAKVRRWKMIELTPISKWIFDYVHKRIWCLTAESVQEHIIKNYSIIFPLHQIRKNLKQVHGLSFKKRNPLPVSWGKVRIKLLKQLFESNYRKDY